VRTCFICGFRARMTDRATGEPLCSQHYYGSYGVREAAVSSQWRMVEDIRTWHAGSAYEKDQQMAKRLEGLKR
jgi:hypothetical protein